MRPAPPVGRNAAPGSRNPIDTWIQERLQREGIAPAPEADRSTLIRRLSLDLVGMPPSQAEVDEFLSDRRPDAYERLVDRLLASPHYGERQARAWLDAARYADTHGYQADRYRPMWPWRDWVIKAFNENLPWDRFVTWQLAGDLLPGATDEQVLATAFNRLHAMESEGGSVEEEYRVNYVNDRVTTFGTAFLGLTLECCRCHDHKFDPLLQADYYRLLSTFTTTIRSEVELDFDPEGYARARSEFDRTHTPFEQAVLDYEANQLPGQFAKWLTTRDTKVDQTGWQIPARVDRAGRTRRVAGDLRGCLRLARVRSAPRAPPCGRHAG